jgi:hypothetical protein
MQSNIPKNVEANADCRLERIFPPNPKRQKPVKGLNLLNEPFGLEFFLRGHARPREGEGLGELDVCAMQ